VKHHGYDTKAAVFGIGVTSLTHVVSCKSILHVQVDIKDVVDIVLLNDALELLVLSANLLQVLGVQSLLGKVDEDAPAPVLLVHRVLYILDLDSDEAPWDEEGYDILRLTHNLANLATNLLPLKNQLFLSADLLLLGDGAELLEFTELF
jgi:hypothetical protein